MEKRERISKTSKHLILATAVLADVFLWLFALIAMIPFLPIGLLGTFGGFIVSFFWNIVLVLWLMGIGVGLKRLWIRIGVLYSTGAAGLLFSLFPFLGGLVSAGTIFINTLLLYFLIKAVEKEDKEYNDLQERKEKKLGSARNAKEYQQIEKQFEEEGKDMKEKSVLNKKHA